MHRSETGASTVHLYRQGSEVGPPEVVRLGGAAHQDSRQVLELVQEYIGMCVALRLENKDVVVLPEQSIDVLYLYTGRDLYVLDAPDEIPRTAGKGVEQSYKKHRIIKILILM